VTKSQFAISSPIRAALAVFPIAGLTVAAFFIGYAVGQAACSPNAWFCGLTEAYVAGLIAAALGSYLVLTAFQVTHALRTGVLAPAAAIGGFVLMERLFTLVWDAPGTVKFAAALGWFMLAYGASNALLNKLIRPNL
jgi:hypothetical protein